MSINAEITDSTQSRLPRFRFSLKTLLILTMLLCSWLGVKAARERRAQEMISRRDAIFGVLIRNLASPPPNTQLIFGPHLLQTFSSRDKRSILNTGKSRGFFTDEAELALGPELTNKPGGDVVRSIADHAGQGLQECRLYWEGGLTQSVGPAWRCIGTWHQDPIPEFTVIIEVIAEPTQSKEAYIWVGVIENQTLFDWNLPTLATTGYLLLILALWIAWLAIQRWPRQVSKRGWG